MTNIIEIGRNYVDCIKMIDEKQNGTAYAGFVYLIKLIDNSNIYKIGWTKAKSLAERMSRLLSNDLKENFYIECLIETDAPKSLEKRLHQEFADKKARKKEYFHLNAKDLQHALDIAKNENFPKDTIMHESTKKPDPTSIEAYLKLIFDIDSRIEVAFVLASIEDANLTIAEISNFTRNTWSETTIRKSIHEIDSYNYIEINKKRKPYKYKLNKKFWDDFHSRRDHDNLARIYNTDLIVIKKHKDTLGMSCNLV